MNREEKSVEIAELSKIFSSFSSIIVANYHGISVSQVNDLRKRLREAGGCVKVIKNSLVKIAIRDTDFQGMSDLFVGQSMIVYSSDPIVAPKVSVGFANDNNRFVIIGGVLEGGVLDKDSIQKIASLPSIDKVRAKIINAIQFNASQLVRILGAPQTQIVRVFSAYVEKDQQQ
ncbi:MAG: 50S ribosomal protein L10 [Candidatus Liberibacter ctenarytainae]|uniref:Large ribosomal subunit protein uL10 n=2 Tax=Candidatus Liberibacter ctenarytainae TaxID=2020335 RepID=A0A937ACA3_9HYPH|nr:50S ribosomal protein L10 [Candidatus Liberibacter ctenarytainae]